MRDSSADAPNEYELLYDPDDLVEEGRILASRREDLIAAGVDPSQLAVPNLPTDAITSPRGGLLYPAVPYVGYIVANLVNGNKTARIWPTKAEAFAPNSHVHRSWGDVHAVIAENSRRNRVVAAETNGWRIAWNNAIRYARETGRRAKVEQDHYELTTVAGRVDVVYEWRVVADGR